MREESMTVQRILNDKGSVVTTCRPQDTIADVARILAEKKIGAVVVIGGGTEGDAVSGILSERDIVRAIAAQGEKALGKQASDFMTENVVTCGLHDSNDDVMQIMTGGRFRHVPVVEDGKLAGIISIGDVVKRRMAEIEREAAEIREYITMS
jgi:CBS domain-containing protein